MKFGKTLRDAMLSKWRTRYVGYKNLKRVIAEVVSSAPSRSLDEFFQSAQEEMNKVEEFFARKEQYLQAKFQALTQKLQHIRSKAQAANGRVLPAELSLQRAMQALHHEVYELKQFAAINKEALRKIVKKLSKKANVPADLPAYVKWSLSFTSPTLRLFIRVSFPDASLCRDVYDSLLVVVCTSGNKA